eukprot:192192-Prymnesium_polylepis.1
MKVVSNNSLSGISSKMVYKSGWTRAGSSRVELRGARVGLRLAALAWSSGARGLDSGWSTP